MMDTSYAKTLREKHVAEELSDQLSHWESIQAKLAELDLKKGPALASGIAAAKDQLTPILEQTLREEHVAGELSDQLYHWEAIEAKLVELDLKKGPALASGIAAAKDQVTPILKMTRDTWGIPQDATDEELDRAKAAYYAKMARDTWGIPQDATDEELDRAKAAYYAKMARDTYGIPQDATDEELDRAKAAHYAKMARDTYGIPQDATDEELDRAKAEYYAKVARANAKMACDT